MKDEIKNAIIRDVRIFIEDHGLLTAFLDLDYGNGSQGFGGYNLGAKGANYCGIFIERTLQIVKVNSWDELKGKSIRAKIEDGLVKSIGNIIEDKWFCPRGEFEALEKEK